MTPTANHRIIGARPRPRINRAGTRALRRPAIAAIGLAFAGLALPGCGSTGPEITAGPYEGPPIEVISRDGVYHLEVQSPSPGWDVTFDRSVQKADERRLFLSLRRPNPAFVYAQVIVEQLVRTDVSVPEDVSAYARVLDYEQDEEGVPYQPVPQDTAGDGN